MANTFPSDSKECGQSGRKSGFAHHKLHHIDASARRKIPSVSDQALSALFTFDDRAGLLQALAATVYEKSANGKICPCVSRAVGAITVNTLYQSDAV